MQHEQKQVPFWRRDAGEFYPWGAVVGAARQLFPNRDEILQIEAEDAVAWVRETIAGSDDTIADLNPRVIVLNLRDKPWVDHIAGAYTRNGEDFIVLSNKLIEMSTPNELKAHVARQFLSLEKRSDRTVGEIGIVSAVLGWGVAACLAMPVVALALAGAAAGVVVSATLGAAVVAIAAGVMPVVVNRFILKEDRLARDRTARRYVGGENVQRTLGKQALDLEERFWERGSVVTYAERSDALLSEHVREMKDLWRLDTTIGAENVLAVIEDHFKQLTPLRDSGELTNMGDPRMIKDLAHKLVEDAVLSGRRVASAGEMYAITNAVDNKLASAEDLAQLRICYRGEVAYQTPDVRAAIELS